MIVDDRTAYAVKVILDSWCRGDHGHGQYLVDWLGYGSEERSWVSQRCYP